MQGEIVVVVRSCFLVILKINFIYRTSYRTFPSTNDCTWLVPALRDFTEQKGPTTGFLVLLLFLPW
jgi:hypothetical protein